MTDRSVPAILMLMGSIVDIDRETANAIRAFIEKVASQYDRAGAILFGSRARKSHRADVVRCSLFVTNHQSRITNHGL